jgi:organic radical activating enzyme
MIQAKHISKLPVMESFYTLQGEGFYSGYAAYFIRLGGCDVGCVWCDVKESWNADIHPKFSVDEIVEKLNKELGIGNWKENDKQQTINKKPIIVITGGEPLMHNLDGLTETLQQQGFQTNIETSGSSPLSGSWDWICVSPKKFKAPLEDVLSCADEYKLVVYHESDILWSEQFLKFLPEKCVKLVQPEWDRTQRILPFLVDFVKKSPQWRISLQTHKFMQIP